MLPASNFSSKQANVVGVLHKDVQAFLYTFCVSLDTYFLKAKDVINMKRTLVFSAPFVRLKVFLIIKEHFSKA
jgi:hypothetical protein